MGRRIIDLEIHNVIENNVIVNALDLDALTGQISSKIGEVLYKQGFSLYKFMNANDDYYKVLDNNDKTVLTIYPNNHDFSLINLLNLISVNVPLVRDDVTELRNSLLSAFKELTSCYAFDTNNKIIGFDFAQFLKFMKNSGFKNMIYSQIGSGFILYNRLLDCVVAKKSNNIYINNLTIKDLSKFKFTSLDYQCLFNDKEYGATFDDLLYVLEKYKSDRSLLINSLMNVAESHNIELIDNATDEQKQLVLSYLEEAIRDCENKESHLSYILYHMITSNKYTDTMITSVIETIIKLNNNSEILSDITNWDSDKKSNFDDFIKAVRKFKAAALLLYLNNTRFYNPNTREYVTFIIE